MIKSILAASEGGPDAAMSFGLAARVAEVCGGTVDALQPPATPSGFASGPGSGWRARAVLMPPPQPGTGPIKAVVVAWNGSFQAARAMNYALPFLEQASSVTVLVVGTQPDDVGAPYLVRHLKRHGITARTDAIDPGAVSGRARARNLLEYTNNSNAHLLVIGAYGRGQVLTFLGLCGATGKVISSCRVPLLLAH